jgi:hypothetical protein
MRRTRTFPLAAGHAPARQRVAVSRLSAGVLAAVMMVLVALACPTNTPIRPGAAGPPMQWAVSGSLAAGWLAVLPARHLDGGVAAASRPNPAPTAVHALLTFVLTVGRHRHRGRPALWLARRPSHRAAGGPRAPPAIPRPS